MLKIRVLYFRTIPFIAPGSLLYLVTKGNNFYVIYDYRLPLSHVNYHKTDFPFYQ